MAWKEVKANSIDIKKNPDEAYIGRLQGSRKIETQLGEQIVWEFIGEDGNKFSIYGFTNLNRALEWVTIGSLCKIVYTGTIATETKYGVKDVHQVSVMVDDDAPEESSKLEAF